MTIKITTKYLYIQNLIKSIFKVLKYDSEIKSRLKYNIDNLHIIAMPINDFDFNAKVIKWLMKNGRNLLAKKVNEQAFDSLTTFYPNDKIMKELFWFIECKPRLDGQTGFNYPLNLWILILCKLLIDESKIINVNNKLMENKKEIFINIDEQYHPKVLEVINKVGQEMINLGEEWEHDI